MLLPIVSEQTLYKTRVDALCTCTYVAMTSKLVYFSGYVFRTLRLYVNRVLRNILRMREQIIYTSLGTRLRGHVEVWHISFCACVQLWLAQRRPGCLTKKIKGNVGMADGNKARSRVYPVPTSFFGSQKGNEGQ